MPPFLTTLTINFGSYLQNDPDAFFTVYFTDDSAGDNLGYNFGTSNAIVVKDFSGNIMSNNVSGHASVSYDYNYSGNNQRGASSIGKPAPITIVAIGKDIAQYVSFETIIGLSPLAVLLESNIDLRVDISKSIAYEIHNAPIKLNPIATDELLLLDSTASYSLKKVLNTLPTLDEKAVLATLTDMTSGMILGRKSPSTGLVEELTAADVRTIINVADGATNYVHPTGDGNLHVPTTSTTNNGKALIAGSTPGSFAWQTLDTTSIGAEPIIIAGNTSQYWRGDKTWQTLDTTSVAGLITSLSGKESSVSTGTTSQYYRGDKSWQNLDTTAVIGLSYSLSGKEPVISSGTTNQYWRGDKTWQVIDTTSLLLNNVTNDAQIKKISSSVDNAVVVWDGATGDLLKVSQILIDSTGNIIPSIDYVSDIGSDIQRFKDVNAYCLNLTGKTYTIGDVGSGTATQRTLGWTEEAGFNRNDTNGYLYLIDDVPTGTFARSDLKLSMVVGMNETYYQGSWIDFGVDLSVYQYKKLTIKDSAGKSLYGTIVSFGTGENTGAELLSNISFGSTTSVTSVYTALTSVAGGQLGNYLKIAQSAGHTNGYAHESITTQAGACILASSFVKKFTGTNIGMRLSKSDFSADLADTGQKTDTDWTRYTIYGTSASTSSRLRWFVNNSASGQYNGADTANAKVVQIPSSTGIYVDSPYYATGQNYYIYMLPFRNTPSGKIFSYSPFGVITFTDDGSGNPFAFDLTCDPVDQADGYRFVILTEAEYNAFQSFTGPTSVNYVDSATPSATYWGNNGTDGGRTFPQASTTIPYVLGMLPQNEPDLGARDIVSWDGSGFSVTKSQRFGTIFARNLGAKDEFYSNDNNQIKNHITTTYTDNIVLLEKADGTYAGFSGGKDPSGNPAITIYGTVIFGSLYANAIYQNYGLNYYKTSYMDYYSSPVHDYCVHNDTNYVANGIYGINYIWGSTIKGGIPAQTGGSPTAQFGTGNNYTMFDIDGTLKMVGTGRASIGSATFDSSNAEKLLVYSDSTSINVISGKGSINNYLQLNIQNQSSGSSASSDVVATADNGSELTNFIDMGINSSTYTANVYGGANDAYLYNVGQNLLIGTGSTGKSLKFLTGGADSTANLRMTIGGTGNVGINTLIPAYQLTQTSTTALESAPLGTELSNSLNWYIDSTARVGIDSTAWIGDTTTGFTHVSGNTLVLQKHITISSASYYQIAFTISGRTSGNISVGLGGATLPTLTYSTDGNYTYGPKTLNTTGDLIFAPTSTFNGRISAISVKSIAVTYNPTYAIVDSAGVSNFEIRSSYNTLSNTFIGKSSARYNTTGYNNNCLGAYCFTYNTTGYHNTAVGHSALYYNTTGYQNTALGNYALYQNTIGHSNTAQGYQTLYNNTTGYQNSAQGFQALYANTTGYQNTAQGLSALASNTTGLFNTAQGVYCLNSNTTASNNCAQGFGTLYANTTGSSNNGQGYQTLYNNTTGYSNTAQGYQTLYNNTTGYSNTAQGYQTLYFMRPTSTAITAFSDYSGTQAGTVKANCASHGFAGTVIRQISGTVNYNGSKTVTNIDGNSFYFTATWVATEAGWCAIDTEARYNTASGYCAGYNITTGDSNTFLGYYAGRNASQLVSAQNSMALGNGTYTTANNQVVIGNTSVTQTLLNGNVAIGTTTFDSSNAEKLLVQSGVTTSYNVISGEGSINNYLQLNIQNNSSGTSSSSDVVATANNGTELTNFIDMGINGSTYTGGVFGAANDAYLYNVGQNLIIGTGSPSKSLIFLTGGTSTSTNTRMAIDGTGAVTIGTSTSYTKFEADGTMMSVGNATTFRDQITDALNLKASGSHITENLTEGTMDFATNAEYTDWVIANFQLNHDRKLTSVVYPHIHFFQTENHVPNFLFQYRWQKLGGPKAISWINLKCNSQVFTWDSTTIHQITSTVAGITPPGGDNVSDILQLRVVRDTANTSSLFTGSDPFTTVAGVLAVDIHVETDTLGSRSEFSK